MQKYNANINEAIIFNNTIYDNLTKLPQTTF